MKIMCIDDDITARAIYTKGLRGALPDDEIVVVDSGEQGLEILNKKKIDIIVTDLIMDGISGIDVLKQAKRLNPVCEVILVTGNASVNSAVMAMQQGARDYLEKPIAVPLLLEKINNIRDYQKRVDEAEEYRFAKETVERNAYHELHLMEKRFQEMQTAVNKALNKIESNQSLLESADLSDIDKRKIQHTLKEILSIFTKFSYNR